MSSTSYPRTTSSSRYYYEYDHPYVLRTRTIPVWEQHSQPQLLPLGTVVGSWLTVKPPPRPGTHHPPTHLRGSQ
eukprot:scaffold595322_cov25-Prasinocladus_malaysianus.AAC.1